MIKTKQELLNHFSDINEMYNNSFMYQTLSNMIDELLEQQTCKDCVSRQAVEEITWEEPSYTDALNVLTEVRDKIRQLPSVTPEFTDEEIQKMQELEQAQLDKAYELGKAESFEEWLYSFNTESASQCFNAVQELKKQIEKKRNT